MKTLMTFLIAIAGLLWLFACNKSNNSPNGDGTTSLKVRMMDAPGNFTQVNVDIIGVEVKINDAATVNLNVVPGIYNLLDYINGVDVLIASADVPSGTLSQIRLILGPNNSVMVDGVIHPLSTPSAMQSGLKLNLHETLVPGVEYVLLLDFDANQSVVLKGNGEYQLKPVIRTVSLANSGSIHGTVVPGLALPATISATDGVNTYTTVADVNGNFLLRGVLPGTYIVTITPQPPLLPRVVGNVEVTLGGLFEMGLLIF